MRRLIYLFILLASAAWALRASAAGVPVVEDSVLVIPAGTLRIEAYAFADRDDFHSVRFEGRPELTAVGDYAFLGCKNLREIILPSSVRTLGQGVFRECGALERVALPKGVSVIPRYAFAWCGRLQTVSMESDVRDIQAHAFAYCGNLLTFDFGRLLTHIGSNAFSFCGSLEEVRLPASITELESYAFAECLRLRRIQLPANPHLLGELILSGCRAMEEVVEMSAAVPKFDCESTLFEPGDSEVYERCVLRVAPGKAAAYSVAPGWNLFSRIKE